MSDPVALSDKVVSIAQAAQAHTLGPMSDDDIRRELDAMRMQAVMSNAANVRGDELG